MSVKAHLLTGHKPLATGEIPFIGFAFALFRISATASPRPVECQVKMAVSEDKTLAWRKSTDRSPAFRTRVVFSGSKDLEAQGLGMVTGGGTQTAKDGGAT